jgi:hypothetical protein
VRLDCLILLAMPLAIHVLSVLTYAQQPGYLVANRRGIQRNSHPSSHRNRQESDGLAWCNHQFSTVQVQIIDKAIGYDAIAKIINIRWIFCQLQRIEVASKGG